MNCCSTLQSSSESCAYAFHVMFKILESKLSIHNFLPFENNSLKTLKCHKIHKIVSNEEI